MWRGQHALVQVQAARIVFVVGGGGSRREPVTRPTGSVERGANATERDTLVGHGCVEGLATAACTANAPPLLLLVLPFPPLLLPPKDHRPPLLLLLLPVV